MNKIHRIAHKVVRRVQAAEGMPDWLRSMSQEHQNIYFKEHPESKYAPGKGKKKEPKQPTLDRDQSQGFPESNRIEEILTQTWENSGGDEETLMDFLEDSFQREVGRDLTDDEYDEITGYWERLLKGESPGEILK